MKKRFTFLFILCSLLCHLNSNAYNFNDKWMGSVELAPTFGVAKGSTPAFQINYTTSYRANEYFGIGLGVGLAESFKFDYSPSIPVFARFQMEDYSKKISPYFSFDLGYDINTENIDYGGILFAPQIGVRLGDFSVGVGYRGEKPNYEGSKVSSAIFLNLAYNFGYHKANSPFLRMLRKVKFGMQLGYAVGASKNGPDYTKEITEGSKSLGTFESKCSNNTISAGYLNLSFLYPISKNIEVGLTTGINVMLSHPIIKNTMDWNEGMSEVKRSNGYTYGEVYESTFRNQRDFSYDPEYNVNIAVRARYNFTQLKFAEKFMPYAQLDLGGLISIMTEAEDLVAGSFYYSPEIGISMDVANGKHRLDLGVGVTPYQTAEYEFEFYGSSGLFHYYTIGGNGYPARKNACAFKIGIGYTF